jgi:hypothetical protein
MPTPVRYLVVSLVAIGLGTITWGVGGLLHWDVSLVRTGDTVWMDARGAIGIGIGALAGAATAIVLFRSPSPSHGLGKPTTERDSLR